MDIIIDVRLGPNRFEKDVDVGFSLLNKRLPRELQFLHRELACFVEKHKDRRVCIAGDIIIMRGLGAAHTHIIRRFLADIPLDKYATAMILIIEPLNKTHELHTFELKLDD